MGNEPLDIIKTCSNYFSLPDHNNFFNFFIQVVFIVINYYCRIRSRCNSLHPFFCIYQANNEL